MYHCVFIEGRSRVACQAASAPGLCHSDQWSTRQGRAAVGADAPSAATRAQRRSPPPLVIVQQGAGKSGAQAVGKDPIGAHADDIQHHRAAARHPQQQCSVRVQSTRTAPGLALVFWRATMMQRRLLGVGELASAGCSATCNLTKRLVIRINIFGRHIACALPPPAPCCHDGRLPFAVCRLPAPVPIDHAQPSSPQAHI